MYGKPLIKTCSCPIDNFSTGGKTSISILSVISLRWTASKQINRLIRVTFTSLGKRDDIIAKIILSHKFGSYLQTKGLSGLIICNCHDITNQSTPMPTIMAQNNQSAQQGIKPAKWKQVTRNTPCTQLWPEPTIRPSQEVSQPSGNKQPKNRKANKQGKQVNSYEKLASVFYTCFWPQF